MTVVQSILDELETAVRNGSRESRLSTLRSVTDLFLRDADRFNVEQIAVFDNVLCHLIARIESRALVELSERLSPVERAPLNAVRNLASHDEIDIARPILESSTCLTRNDLITIATTKSQAHLLAISARPRIEPDVTDVLIRRGDSQVFHRLADNRGARFSAAGFDALVEKSARDDDLGTKVGLRLDLPLRLLRQLLQRATDAVRNKLLAAASPESREEILRVISAISEDEGSRVDPNNHHLVARNRVHLMHQDGKLHEATLIEFLAENNCAAVVAGLSCLCACGTDVIERLLYNEQREAFLIPCKAVGFGWDTVAAILRSPCMHLGYSDSDMGQARTEYLKLSQTTAQRVLRFWQIRQAATVAPAQPDASKSDPGHVNA
jgi:uncharacterized protein (DUF2336 family)